MPLFDAPMFLAPVTPPRRRYRGADFAGLDRGYGPRYARRGTPAPLAGPFVAWPTWPSGTLARIGDAWVLQEPLAA